MLRDIWAFLTESEFMNNPWTLTVPFVLVVAGFRYAYRKDKR
jgi:hypothetical protein